MTPDLLIIGGGAAALTSALYALRAGLNVTIIEKESIGGQIATSPRVENFPSILAISGAEFANNLFEQVDSLGVNLEMDEILSLEKKNDLFVARGNYGEYKGKSAIIATGVKHRHLGLESEETLSGISYCAVCDGAFYENKDVMVIGDANSALQYALLLAKTSRHVTVVTLFDRFFADKALVIRLLSLSNVSIIHDYKAIALNGERHLESVTFLDKVTNTKKTLHTDGLFIAIGQVPDNERFANLVDLENGYFLVDENMGSKTAGLFVAGDCRKKQVRQLTTACNDGAIAALSAFNYLLKRGN